MTSDVVGSLFMMESDRAAPQTPPLMEPHHRRSNSGAASFARHRKTSSGFWNLDMEKLMEFPVEALPPDNETELSHHLADSKQGQEMKVDVEQEITVDDPASNPTEGTSTAESDFDYGVDAIDGGSISWPATPSCGSHKAKTGDDYDDSDQDTVVEDETSSGEYDSDNEDDDVLKEWNMNITLVDDESFGYSMPPEIDPPSSDFSSDSVLPDFVGLDPDSALVSIPEDSEVCLDKVGNHVLEEEKSAVRVSLECIEYDAAGWSSKPRSCGVQEGAKKTSDTIESVDQPSEKSNKTMRRPISHQEAVEAIIDRGNVNKKPYQARNRHTKSDMSDLFDPVEDIVVACEVVIPNMNSLVTPSNKNGRQLSEFDSADDVKVSSGCCAGLKKLSAFGKARRRIEAIGQALKRHWPIITSAVVPLVLFFSCRRQ